jgi:2-polyprenyl-3-methyl-5-hydroxy-6-metoxy-1,4-benzoquinol methylase
MKSDFRKKLYEKYNSSFKTYLADFNPNYIASIWKSYDYLYLPLISSFPKDVGILELGCGRGYLLEYLKNHGFNNLKGIDISEEQIEISQKKGFDVKVADAFEYLEIHNSKFKLIFALDFVEHFYKEELFPLFERIFESLEDGGLLIMHTPNGQAIVSSKMIYGDLTHLTIFTPDSAEQLLRNIGFKEIKCYESEPVPKNSKSIIRWVLWKFIKFIYNLIRLVEIGVTEKILTQNFVIAAKK